MSKRFSLITYEYEGLARPGLLVGEKIIDLREHLSLPDHFGLINLFENWEDFIPRLHALALVSPEASLTLEFASLRAPIEKPFAIYCAGANYRQHVDNMSKRLSIPREPDPHEVDMAPWFFIKTASTIVGPNSEVKLECEVLDWEAELALVIGKPTRNVQKEKVLDHVAGYLIANDLSARDRMKRRNGVPGTPFEFDWIGHKSFENSCPLGPLIVPTEFVGDPQKLDIKLWVNGHLRQDSNSQDMLFSIAEQLEHLSTVVTLHPGDIVLTGTPHGVGAETGDSLSVGDKIDIEIEGLGHQVTRIV